MSRYALVIGIGRYKYEALPDLSKPAGDAEAVAQILRDHGRFQAVTLIQDQEATGERLGQELRRLLQEQAIDQEALIYFTGHGITVTDALGEQQAALTSWDCGIVKDADRRVITAQDRGLPFQSLNGLIRGSQVRRLVVILDCCHGGALLDQVQGGLGAMAQNGQDRFLIVSCRSFEQAQAWSDQPHSVFTGALLEALRQDQANDHGEVTAGRIFDVVQERLRHSGQEPRHLGMGRSIPVVTYGVTAVEAEVSEECPYQGLRAFERETARFFFGREKVVADLVERLGRSRFVPLIGVSGSGKSSVVRAGLILEWERWGQVLRPMKPDAHPIASLQGSIQELFPGAMERREIYRGLEDGDLGAVIERLTGPVLLVVDQFEEVFTICAQEEERRRFIELITQVERQFAEGNLWIVLTLRADFVENCLAYESLTGVIQSQGVYIPALQGQGLRDAIVKPAEEIKYKLESGLLELILRDVERESNCLPLLEFALTKLWDLRDQQERKLTVMHYRALGDADLGGVLGALNQYAEGIYRKLTEEQQEWARRICLKLVRTGEGSRDTRQRRSKRELLQMADGDPEVEQIVNRVFQEFGDLGRLIVFGKEEQNDTEEWVDLAHEALTEAWSQFRKWREEDRDLRRIQDRVDDAYQEWIKSRKDDRYLIKGGLLIQVKERHSSVFQESDLEKKEYLSLSLELEEREEAGRRKLAEIQLQEDIVEVDSLLESNPTEGLLLALSFVKQSDDMLSDIHKVVQDRLRNAVDHARERNILNGHQGNVLSVAISSDSRLIASGGSDNVIRLWDLKGNQLTEPFRGHEDAVKSIIFGARDEFLITGSADMTIRLWDLNGNELCKPFWGHLGAIRSVALHPNGKIIASGSTDRTIRLWDLQGEIVGQSFRRHEGSVLSVCFSPGGRSLVSGSDDSFLCLWDLEGNLLGSPFQGHEDSVWSVCFSPDGQTIASGGDDLTIRLWDLSGTEIVTPFQGHESSISSITFTPDGKSIISASDDQTIRIWDLSGNQRISPLRGHENCISAVAYSRDRKMVVSGSDDHSVRVWDLISDLPAEKIIGRPRVKDLILSIDFSPDGQTIVSGGYDGTVRLWDLQGNPIGSPFQGHKNPVWSVCFSPEGETIVSGGYDGTVRLWDLQGNPIGSPFQGRHKDPVRSVCFSPEGETIVSGGFDGTVRLWDLQGNPIGSPFQGHKGYVWSVCFSPQGETIVSGGVDGTVRLWDLQGNSIGSPFQGHEDPVWSVCFSPQGETIVSGGVDGTVRLWDLQGNPIGSPFQGHEDHVWSVCFSPDGETIVSGGADGTVRLWDLQGHPIGSPFQGHEHSVSSVCFSPDGQTIASASFDGMIRLWRGNWRSWLQICCDRIRHHPIVKDPDHPTAQAAYAVCQKYIWDRQDQP